MTEALDAIVDLGPEAWHDARQSGQLEWLCTNGIGGYACGTVGGLLQRRWHGLLVAATDPPAGRTLLVPKIELFVTVDGREWSLAANEWGGCDMDAPGLGHLVRMHMAGSVVVRHWRIGSALLEERIAMKRESNTTAVLLTLRRSSSAVKIRIKAMVNRRPHDRLVRANSVPATFASVNHGLRVNFTGTTGEGSELFLQADDCLAVADGTWYSNYLLPVERALGYDCVDAHMCAGDLTVTLKQGESRGFTASTREESNGEAHRIVQACLSRSTELIHAAKAHGDHFRSRLVLAADQFIVRRSLPDGQRGTSVIAGYPWFADWGRDALISLPGLCLATGRANDAADIIRSLARFQRDGLLPNRFPAPDEPWLDNSVDAPLLLAEAARRTVATTHDWDLARDMWPALQNTFDAFIQGTRHGIKVDARDGLLAATEPGTQLTWMDAKVQDRVITPRMGKPVEVNALWCGLLHTMIEWAPKVKQNSSAQVTALDKARTSFARFLRPDGNGLLDVLDGPSGDDASLRPNQLMALCCCTDLVPTSIEERMLDVVQNQLLTPLGLRTLGPHEPGYRGRFEGSVEQRDEAYHMGTAWPWLLGPYLQALRKAKRDSEIAIAVEPFLHHLRQGCLGQICEVADGDAPQRPAGCFAQAWSVAALLDHGSDLP